MTTVPKNAKFKGKWDMTKTYAIDFESFTMQYGNSGWNPNRVGSFTASAELPNTIMHDERLWARATPTFCAEIMLPNGDSKLPGIRLFTGSGEKFFYEKEGEHYQLYRRLDRNSLVKLPIKYKKESEAIHHIKQLNNLMKSRKSVEDSIT